MQINNNGITNNTNTNNRQKAVDNAVERSGGSDTSAASKDSVQLSREAMALKQLESQIIASPDVDLARVESIRQAIADGSYEVNAESIALKMLDTDDLL